MVNVMVHGEWLYLVRAVHAAAACVDEMGNLMMATSLQDVAGRDQVRIDIRSWVLDGIAHSGLSSEMHNAIKTILLKKPIDCVGICEIESFQAEGKIGSDLLESRFLQRY